MAYPFHLKEEPLEFSYEFERQNNLSAPALVGAPEKNSLGETFYIKIGIGNGLPANTGIFIPNSFKPNSDVTVVIYLHGHKGAYPGNAVLINGYWDGTRFPFFALREEVAASRRNVILVAPSLGPTSQAGNLVDRGGFDTFVRQVLSGLNAHHSLPRYGRQIGDIQNIILAAHSGGGWPMLRIAAGNDQYAAKIKECWCFDGMYGSVANAWVTWAKSHPGASLHVYYGPAKGQVDPKTGKRRVLPRDNAEAIAREVRKLGLKNVCVQPSRATSVGRASAHFWVPKVHLSERLLSRPCASGDVYPDGGRRTAGPTASTIPPPNPQSGNHSVLQQIQNALASGQWYTGLGLAVLSGTRDESKLASMIFFARHPERGGRKLEKSEPDFRKLSQEWLDIRDKLVRPFLAKNSPATSSDAKPAAPVAGKGRYPEVNVLMPQDGPGFYSYNNANHRYGRAQTIETLKAIALGWQKAYPRGPRIGIGDISLLGGGPTPRHKSHQTGLDVDLRLMRSDNQQKGVRYQDATYSRALTQELVNRIINNGILRVQYIFFNDPQVTSVRKWPGHDNHLHVRFYPPDSSSSHSEMKSVPSGGVLNSPNGAKALSSPQPPINTVAQCKKSPASWAREKLSKMRRWWNDQDTDRAGRKLYVGRTLRDLTPKVFAGVPVEAIVGFCANGNITENTTEGVAAQKFHEIGLFGTEAGLRAGPAPNPDPRAPYNRWGKLAHDPRVKQLLGGRPATMKHNEWKSAIPDQAAVGLINLLDHGRSVAAKLHPSIRPAQSSLFFVACCFMGWSAGDAAASRHLNQFTAILASVPEGQRWSAFLRAVAQGIRSGQLNLRGQKRHRNVAYSAQRTWQKLAAGQLLASQVGGSVGWFDLRLGSDEAWIANLITCSGNVARYGSNLAVRNR